MYLYLSLKNIKDELMPAFVDFEKKTGLMVFNVFFNDEEKCNFLVK